MYRTLDGRLSSGSKDVHVLMITTPRPADGRRRAPPCVRFLETPKDSSSWGTGSGSPRDPDWFRNLRAAEVAQVQVRDRHLRRWPVSWWARERDAMWNDVVLAEAPEVAKYERRAGRTIPVAVLRAAGLIRPRLSPRAGTRRTRCPPGPRAPSSSACPTAGWRPRRAARRRRR